MHFTPCFPPQDISGTLFLIYRIFVASIDLEDMIENVSIVKISSNSGKDMTKISAVTWEMIVYGMYFLERGKEIGMSHKTIVENRFPLLQIHICFDYFMCK